MIEQTALSLVREALAEDLPARDITSCGRCRLICPAGR